MKLFAQFEVRGVRPIPWSTPHVGNKVTKAGKRYRFTTRNKELEFWQAYVKEYAKDYMRREGKQPSAAKLAVVAEFAFQGAPDTPLGRFITRAIAWDEDQEAWVCQGEAVPDADNLFKGTMDALQGVVFHNDTQICVQASSRRWWHYDGVHLAIHEYDEADGELKRYIYI